MSEHPTFPGWTVIEELGRGGMCTVYRVAPDDGGPERAIKRLTDTSASAADRFRAEADLLRAIEHPNVLRVHALEVGPPPWIVMDLLAGLDLEEGRVEHGAMEPERAATLFADLASGLAAVHARGVRHRDLKPANVMMGHDGVPRLIDFGIARQTTDAHVTAQGYVVGTASYLPPEIFAHRDTAAIQDTEVADVYALGQTLCEVVSGEPVHARLEAEAGAVLVEIMRDKLDRDHLDPREWRSSVPEGLAAIVMRATAREPEDRTPTAAALETELRAWVERRRSGYVAPVTKVDPSQLPPPPVTPRPAPGRVPTPAPANTGSAVGAAGAAAASAAGLSLLGGALAALTGVIVVLLWVLAPTAPAPSTGAASALQQAVDRLDISRCADGPGTATASWRVERRKATGVQVDGHGAACIARVVQKARFPAEADGVQVTWPVRFD